MVGKDHRSSPSVTPKEENQISPHVSNLLHKVYHTCMLRDLQTSTQAFLKFTTTQLARVWYYYLHISKQSSSIKLLIVFKALYIKVFIISLSNAYHIRTSFITKSNYTSCFKFVTQSLPYVHATGLANFNTSIPQIHNYSTSTTLISLPPCLKTIIKDQTSLSIQYTHKKVLLVLNT